jgi:multiple antibiotic resistance protein
LTEKHPGGLGVGQVSMVMVSVLILVYVMFAIGPVLERLLGKIGINVVTRILGMLLAALAVQFVMDGITTFSEYMRPGA